MTDNLLPISQIIKQSRAIGVTFGHGNPKIHLAYLTKLRLLPQSVRRKIGNKIEGCYPESVIPLLKQVEELKDRGLTYSQIRFQIQENQIQETGSGMQVKKQETGIWERTPFSPNSPLPASLPISNFQNPVSFPVSHYLNPASGSNVLAFLLIGLLLGYLLAISNLSRPSSASPASPVTNDKSLITSVSPLDDQTKTMLGIITNNQTETQNPIYVIAVPAQNLDRLGKININQLAPTASN